MLFRVIDENFQTLTTFLDEDLVDDEQWISGQGSTYSLVVRKLMDGSEFVTVDNMIVFRDENNRDQLYTIMKISAEDEKTRTVECESYDTALIGNISNSYPSNRAQTIDYFVNRELYDTVWKVRLNELPNKTALPDCTSDSDTKKARLYDIAVSFGAELDFVLEFNGSKLVHAYIDIYQQRGRDLSNEVTLRTNDEIETIQRTIDAYTSYTEIKVIGSNADISKIKYDDGVYYTEDGSNILFNREAKMQRGRAVTGFYRSDKSGPTDILAEGLEYLKQNDELKANYEVSIVSGTEKFDVLDYVEIIDNDYSPAIRLKARVLEKYISRTDPSKNKAFFGNFTDLESGISNRLLAIQNQIDKIEPKLSITITPNAGTAFVDEKEQITELTATVYSDNMDITETLSANDFIWHKVDKNGVHDDVWEAANIDVGRTVSVNSLSVDEVSMIKCLVNVYKNKWVQAIYFLDALKNLVYKVERLRTPDTLVVPVITDTHYATDVMNKPDIRGNLMVLDHVKNFVEFTNMVDCDFALHNGDFVDGRTTKKENTRNIGEFMELFGQVDCPFFIAIGNHDDNRYGNRANGNVMEQFITPAEMYSLVTTTSRAFGVIDNPDDRNSYYYYDIPKKKYRHIMLNTYDHPYSTGPNMEMLYINNGGYRAKQIEWFIDVLKNTPEDYFVSVSQHCSMGTGYNDTNPDYLKNALIVEGILGAYRNGTTYQGNNTVDQDFLVNVDVSFDKPHNVVFVCNGHHHVDRVKMVNNIVNITTAKCNPDDRTQTWWTASQDLWDVFIINTKTRHVDVLRYGFSDKNRQFDF